MQPKVYGLSSLLVFWSFVKVHLGKLEEERFMSLQKATTDAGRGEQDASDLGHYMFTVMKLVF